MSSWLSKILSESDGPRIRRWPLKLAGLLLIGALGSGLWDSILKPVFKRAGYWLLDVASLGLDSYRASIYRQIATGASPLAASALELTTLIYVFVWFVLLAALFFAVWELDRIVSDLKGKADELNDSL